MKERIQSRPRHATTVLLALLWLLAFSNGSGRAQAGPLDHGPFDRLLGKHVAGGVVDYGGFSRERAALDAYLASLAEADISAASRGEKLAFYINAYNACTIRLILRHLGSIESIRDIDKPWDTKEWKLAGETLSLNQVEHEKLRDELKEPRIHFAIVCASIGCPDLAAHAYTAREIEAQLDEAARRFLQSEKHVRTSVRDGLLGKTYTLHLSRIFKWFGDDFTAGGTAPVTDFVVKYTDREKAAFIREHAGRLDISYLDYDWKLNGKD